MLDSYAEHVCTHLLILLYMHNHHDPHHFHHMHAYLHS